MNRTPKQTDQGNQLRDEIAKYASFQPFVGLFCSAAGAFFLLFREKPWSWELILNQLVPFVGFSCIYAVIAAVLKVKYGVSVPFLNRRVRLPACFLILLLVGFNLLLRFAA